MSVIAVPVARGSATDRVLRAVQAALEAKRIDLDADPFLEAVRIEVRLIVQGDDARRGYEAGDVRAVVVQHQTEMRMPPR